MENDETNIENQHTGALSLYGQTDAAMDDFPVLKAFQQYIDAEQSKSRKRMILLCMFFGVLMTVLVAVFVLVLAQMNRDKQQANEQLIQFLMKERAQPAFVPQQQLQLQPPASTASDAALKAMTETLVAIQQEVAEQKKAAQEEALLAPSKAELELQRKTERETARIRRARELLEAEKRKLAEEKERLRQEEVERQRQRLYPEYYQKQQAQQAPSPAPAAQPTATPRPKPQPRLSDEDIDDILREVDALRAADEEKARMKKKAALKKKTAASRKEVKKNADDSATDADRPLEYFTETEYALPVNLNGEDSGWSVPLD